MSSCPVSTLHIRTLRSSPPGYILPLQEATSEPSAEKLTPLTCELYFGFKLVTTLTTLCNGRLRLCRFLEVSCDGEEDFSSRILARFTDGGETGPVWEHICKVIYASPPVRGGDTQRFAKAAHLCPVKG